MTMLPTPQAGPAPAQPSSKLAQVLANHPGARREHLIPLLQAVQEAEGFLSHEAIVKIAEHINVPASKVYGVATFYNQFRFQPQGKFHIQVCRGTACHVKGSANVLTAFERTTKIKAGNTTRDGTYSLEVVACVGACGLAPVVVMGGEYHAAVAPEKVPGLLINSYRKKAAAS